MIRINKLLAFFILFLSGCAIPAGNGVKVAQVLQPQVYPLGSLENPLIDSNISLVQALKKYAPIEIKERQERVVLNAKFPIYLVIPFIFNFAKTNIKLFLGVFILMWCPAVAAFSTKIIYERSLRGLGWGLAKPYWYFLSYLLPALSGLLAYGFIFWKKRAKLYQERS